MNIKPKMTWNEYKQKKLAREATTYAIKSGRLVRPKNCPKCGTKIKVEAHHKNYAEPLNVEWLCRPCHSTEHGVSSKENDKEIIRIAMGLIGAIKTERKATASRINGCKGGRPKNQVVKINENSSCVS